VGDENLYLGSSVFLGKVTIFQGIDSQKMSKKDVLPGRMPDQLPSGVTAQQSPSI